MRLHGREGEKNGMIPEMKKIILEVEFIKP
jgi:hypothetical protein